MSRSDESELNVSAELHTPVKKATRKKDKKSRSRESEELPVYGTIGTPMVPKKVIDWENVITVEKIEEWEAWRRRELEKAGHKPIVRREPTYERDELPEISDSVHLLDRQKHIDAVERARKQVKAQLVAINERGINVADDDEIAIQVNGRNLSKQLCKKYQKALKKDVKKLKRTTTEDIFSEDEEDREFNKRWAPQREKIIEDWAELREEERDNSYDPLEEYMHSIGDRTGDLVTAKGYTKWLEEKVNAGEISWKYTLYEQELRKMKKNMGLKSLTKSKFKKLVNNVQSFYKEHHH